MKRSISRSQLVSEIAGTTKLTKKDVSAVLKDLTRVAYREAAQGFIVPGICKLVVVRRKARRCRIPSTGQLVLIGERDGLKAVPLGVAKTNVTPKPEGLMQILEETQTPEISTRPASGEDALDSADESPGLPDGGSIVFPCEACGAMVSAPPASAGNDAECPFCGADITIPQRQTSSLSDASAENSEHCDSAIVEDFITFVCQACGQEIEASTSMAGFKANCPTCGSILGIPNTSTSPSSTPMFGNNKRESNADMSMTMRIDLSDLE